MRYIPYSIIEDAISVPVAALLFDCAEQGCMTASSGTIFLRPKMLMVQQCSPPPSFASCII